MYSSVGNHILRVILKLEKRKSFFEQNMNPI